MLKRFTSAERYYIQALTIRKSLNETVSIGYSYFGLASMYELAGKFQRGLPLLNLALEIAVKAKDARLQQQASLALGRFYFKTGDLNQSIPFLKKAYNIAVKLKLKTLLAEPAGFLANWYAAKKRYKQAFEYSQISKELSTQIQAETELRKIDALEANFAIQKATRDKEIYRLKEVKLKNAYKVVARRNEEITSSIQYASRIQKAMMPLLDNFSERFPESGILFRPKDVVSGDFYWYDTSNENLFVAVADCTGHGVPGALLSMLAMAKLHTIVKEKPWSSASEVLQLLRAQIINQLNQFQTSWYDSLDIVLCKINLSDHFLEFAGAYNPLFIIRRGELLEFKGDKFTVGKHHYDNQPFTNTVLKLYASDRILMTTDGYKDQLGGEKGKKIFDSAF